ncbi:hypothetical protein [Butyrivibrio fibrisolvens]|uniref:hypothetical protein n=1 Tax=Butyrivibrio fibrisolvens TaxID=831 RepID=UPI0004208D38|nr:hypothetical protein [Butyrivibrio fibrisolvens]
MNKIFNSIKENVMLILAIKTLVCVVIIMNIAISTFHNGIDSYCDFKDYSEKIEYIESEVIELKGYKEIKQIFTATGNKLNNVSVFTGNISDEHYSLSVETLDNKTVVQKDISSQDLNYYDWSTIGISNTKLERNENYYLVIRSKNDLSGFFYRLGVSPGCYADDQSLEGHFVAGLSSTYSYITVASFFEIFIKALVSIFLATLLCISIIRFEKISLVFIENKKIGLPYALYFAFWTVLLYNPLDSANTDVVSFKRVIGSGLINGVDVSRRISNFNHWFVSFGIAFILFWMFFNYFLKSNKNDDCRRVQEFLDGYMIFANSNLAFRAISFFKDSQATDNVFWFSQFLIMLITILLIVFFALRILNIFIDTDKFEKILVIEAALAVMLTIFYGRELGDGRIYLGIFALLNILILVIVNCFQKTFASERIDDLLVGCVIVTSSIPLLSSLYIESIHVLNRHGIFVAHPAKYYKVVCIIGFMLFALSTFVFKKYKCHIKDWKRISFPLFVFGISCLSVQIPLSSTYSPDLFEGANSGILMSDFLNYGDIPIVQHYGGHMMTGVWEGILYALINNDYTGIVSPYESLITPILVLLIYLIISKIWKKEMALLLALLFPLLDYFSYYGLGILICIAAMSYVKKDTWGRAIILWGTFVWCALYRLDLGFAFGVAVIVTLTIYVFVNKNRKALKQLLISLLGWFVLCCSAWFVICFVKEINPVNRLIEFLMINLSNQNWAYGSIGAVENTVFAWVYIIVPFFMVIACTYTIISSDFRKRISTEKWVLLLILGFSYFMNFSRGLVRHSLLEHSTTVVIWSAYLFMALFVCCYRDSIRLFLPSFMLLMILDSLFVSDAVFSGTSVADSAVTAPEPIIESWKPTRFQDEEKQYLASDGTAFLTSWEKIKYEQEVIDRVVLEENLSDYISEYELLLNELLEENETFVDFINKTLIYSVMGKRCPVYVSQSPMQLSGEYAQEEFIKQIEGVPIVLMPVDSVDHWESKSLDDVTNAYRYYKVSEYIYQNYIPLCKYDDDYAVWCLPQKYDVYKKKIKNSLESNVSVELIDYGYDGPVEKTDEAGNTTYDYYNGLHNAKIEYLPRIWAESDMSKAVSNSVVCELTNTYGLFTFDNSFIKTKSNGNYLKISAGYDGNDVEGCYKDDDEFIGAVLVLGYYENGIFNEKCRYSFIFEEGEHDYLIRISTDYYWYLGQINAARIEMSGELRNVNMKVLEGD